VGGVRRSEIVAEAGRGTGRTRCIGGSEDCMAKSGRRAGLCPEKSSHGKQSKGVVELGCTASNGRPVKKAKKIRIVESNKIENRTKVLKGILKT